jgi:c-di-GMP-binding flagellar brake protein YcgR
MSDQRRQHPRYAIELDAAIVTDERQLSGRTNNLSKGGFCMLADDSLPLGTPCRAKLALVFSENQFSEHLELEATVVWSTPTAGRYQVGVKFAKLDAQSRNYLDLFIQFLEGGEDDTESHDG